MSTDFQQARVALGARLRELRTAAGLTGRELAAGHRPVQDALTVEYERTSVFRAWEPAMVVGMLQTAAYARHLFTRYADLHRSVRDTDDAVRARIERQHMLYQPGRRFHILLWEAALHAGIAPPDVLTAQLDRLSGVVGLDTVDLGIIPLNAQVAVPPTNGFWLYDRRLVVVEDWHAELWLDDPGTVELYGRVWDTLRTAAVTGAEAQHVIARARARINR